MKCVVVGCGLSGSVIARCLADCGIQVTIWERRNHIGGNMYDYVDEHGFLVHQYGPHIFHTSNKEIYDYICQFEQWTPFRLTCGAYWDGKYTPTPFNFTTIDTFYSPVEAKKLKSKILSIFGGRETATVVEALNHSDPDIRAYAEFLFKNDYAPYTAKQWGVSPETIDPSVLRRVPLRFSYENHYFDDEYEIMPMHSYTHFFTSLLDHPNITIEFNKEALDHLTISENHILIDGQPTETIVIYTGALDELFGRTYGRLPYRSLRFQWKYSEKDSLQQAPVVAYPKEEGFTRITEYKKLPPQNGKGTSYAVEYPIAYSEDEKQVEPYYPVLTKESQKQYQQYDVLAKQIPNLFVCGRLGDFKYYNMDEALERALSIASSLKNIL